MSRGELGTYVIWRTGIPTPRWFDGDLSRHPSRLWAWASSNGIVQLRLR